MTLVIDQLFPFFAGDPAGKPGRIERRPAGISQHFAIVHIEGDNGTGLPLHRVFRSLLQGGVKGEVHAVPGQRLTNRHLAHLASFDIDLDPLASGLPTQLVLEQSLQTGFADHITGTITGELWRAQFVFGDLTKVSEQVGGHFPVWISAQRFDLNQNPRQINRVLLDLVHGIPAHIDQQR